MFEIGEWCECWCLYRCVLWFLIYPTVDCWVSGCSLN